MCPLMSGNSVVHKAIVPYPSPDERQRQELAERPLGDSLPLRAILVLYFLSRRGLQNIALWPTRLTPLMYSKQKLNFNKNKFILISFTMAHAFFDYISTFLDSSSYCSMRCQLFEMEMKRIKRKRLSRKLFQAWRRWFNGNNFYWDSS